jgi:hypothetical protein
MFATDAIPHPVVSSCTTGFIVVMICTIAFNFKSPSAGENATALAG